jgi:hypothetical protein
MTETIRTLQAASASLFAPAREDSAPSFWRRLLLAIMAGRQRKADECVADYLQYHLSEDQKELRAAIKQRLADSKRRDGASAGERLARDWRQSTDNLPRLKSPDRPTRRSGQVP